MKKTWAGSWGAVVVGLAMAACSGGSTGDAADVVVPDGTDTGGDHVALDATDIVTPPDVPVIDVPAADVPDGSVAARTTQTNGSTIAIAANDSVAVAANRTADSISVFTLTLGGTPPTLSRTAQISTGAGSHPWGVVIGNDNETAYGILRGTRQVVKITGLSTAPTLSTTMAATGSEPTGIAISPSGAKLYVANWGDGTVTVVNTADMSVASTIDLNGPLAATGLLGSSVPTAGRPGLAHPRAIVITNGGTGVDANETAYVTEFFSQALPGATATGTTQIFDVNRQGVVYRFNLGTGAVGTPITLAPVQNTTFNDSNGNTTGCFPNQLYAASINNGRLYVASVCESPAGPIGPTAATPPDTSNFKTEIFSLLSVVNTSTNTETAGEQLNMTARWEEAYTGVGPGDAGTGDAGAAAGPLRRLPLIVNDMAFVGGTDVFYSTAYGSDAVFRIPFGSDGTSPTIGSTMNFFIDLNPGGTIPAGNLPIGIAISNTGLGTALVLNENTRNVSLVTLASQLVLNSIPSADAPTAAGDIAANAGRKFFVTGLGRWSLSGDSWNSCEACHGDGLTDNVTWFFARGPRQTISLDGTYAPDGVTQRILNWSAINDEVHDFELNTRGNSGGVGAVVTVNSTPPAASDRIIIDGTAVTAPQVGTATLQNGLSGSVTNLMPAPTGTGVPAATAGTTAQSVNDSWDQIDAYVRRIAAPHAPTNLSATDVTAGQALFAANYCAGCHGGADWTVSERFYTPSQARNAPCVVGGPQPAGSLCAAPYSLAGFPAALNPPATGTPLTAPIRFIPDATHAIGAFDQINCVLRAVGTFPTSGMVGIAPAGVTVTEERGSLPVAPATMPALAQGATGYNPPSLFSVAIGAPYYHAGNARSLEEVFDPTFVAHSTAMSTNFLTDAATRAMQIQQIVAYLLSIDESTVVVGVPTSAVLGYNPVLCPATFP